MIILSSVSRNSLQEIEAVRIAMRSRKPTEPSLEHQRHLSQRLPAEEAKTNRAMRFSVVNAGEVTSVPTSM